MASPSAARSGKSTGPHPVPFKQQRALVVAVLVAAFAMAAPSAWALIVTVGHLSDKGPTTISYQTLPVPVEARKVHAGDTLRLLPARCANDIAGTGLGAIPFVYTARLIAAEGNQVAVDLPGGVSQAEVGCHQTRQTALAVPEDTAPGSYFVEGTSIAVGANRGDSVRWRTEVFEVIP